MSKLPEPPLDTRRLTPPGASDGPGTRASERADGFPDRRVGRGAVVERADGFLDRRVAVNVHAGAAGQARSRGGLRRMILLRRAVSGAAGNTSVS
jgi:hypothetical protein